MTMSVVVAFRNEQEIREVVEQFEACIYAPEEFVHRYHIAVAVVYLLESNCELEAAMVRMKASLFRFSAHHKKMGYNETITRFWLALVRDFLESQETDADLAGAVNATVVELADKNLLFAYYSRERALSDEAKRQWLEPDLKPAAFQVFK